MVPGLGPIALKEQGNKHFKDGEYSQAVECYTLAIRKSSENPQLFINRAMAYMKLAKSMCCTDKATLAKDGLEDSPYDLALNDSIRALELDPKSMKARFYLAQCQLALKHPNEAYVSALEAYQRCVETQDKSIARVSATVLQAKKERWRARERQKLQDREEVWNISDQALQQKCDQESASIKSDTTLNSTEQAASLQEVRATWEQRRQDLRRMVDVTSQSGEGHMEIPDYLIDNITFSIMHDPVVTKTGNSYDRATLIEHLKRTPTDPLTREPLTIDELRPNLALKQACEEFLEENGWAVDW